MRSAIAPKAKVAAASRSRGSAPRDSRSSFSAAADLVVKPATPPRSISGRSENASAAAGSVSRISGGVGNATFAAGSSAQGYKADTRSDIGGIATKLVSPPKTDSTRVHAVHTKQDEEVPEVLAAEELGRQALVEVRGLSGESLVKADFQCSDRVSSVKDRILKTRSIPLWQQMLSFQGEMLNDQSTLGDLNLQQGAVFDLVLKSGPSPEDMEALADVAREALMAGTKGMNTVRKTDVAEVRAMKCPPAGCEKVCSAALYMLAGLAKEIPIKRDGSPKDAGWSGCQIMMKDSAGFVRQVLELPSCIDQGRVKEDCVVSCRQLIDAIEGDSDSEKIQYVTRCSLMCMQLITFLIGVVKYYDSVAEFRERFGGATITQLKSHQ